MSGVRRIPLKTPHTVGHHGPLTKARRRRLTRITTHASVNSHAGHAGHDKGP